MRSAKAKRSMAYYMRAHAGVNGLVTEMLPSLSCSTVTLPAYQEKEITVARPPDYGSLACNGHTNDIIMTQ